MSKEVNELLDKLGKLEDAPLIWINKKVYDASKEIERLKNQLQQKENIIKEVREYIEKNTQWYDKELGLVEMEGYETDRIPVIYKYGLLKILDKGE